MYSTSFIRSDYYLFDQEIQGCGMTFDKLYVGSMDPYFISDRGKWVYIFCGGCTSYISFISSSLALTYVCAKSDLLKKALFCSSYASLILWWPCFEFLLLTRNFAHGLKSHECSFIYLINCKNQYCYLIQWWQLLFGQSIPYVVNGHFSRWSDRPLKCCLDPLL